MRHAKLLLAACLMLTAAGCLGGSATPAETPALDVAAALTVENDMIAGTALYDWNGHEVTIKHRPGAHLSLGIIVTNRSGSPLRLVRAAFDHPSRCLAIAGSAFPRVVLSTGNVAANIPAMSPGPIRRAAPVIVSPGRSRGVVVNLAIPPTCPDMGSGAPQHVRLTYEVAETQHPFPLGLDLQVKPAA
jgi:hypothetical protein